MNNAKPRFFYGWVIVAFTFIVQFVTIGLGYYSLGVFLKPLASALEADRFEISLAMMIQAIVIALASPIAGRWFAHHDVRRLMFVGAAALCTGFLLLSQISSVWHLYILFGGLVGIGMVLLGVIPSSMLLANWFDDRRGTALGVSQFGITISATVLVPLVTWIVLNYSWQTAFAACGIGALVILLPMIQKFAIRAPESMGLHPDGRERAPPTVETTDDDNWNFARAVRNRDIWALTLTVGPCYLGIASVVLTLPSHITDLGISALDAASVVAITTFMGAIAKPTFGFLSDYLDPRAVMTCAIILQFIGVGLLLNADDLLTLSVAGGCFGLGYGGVATLWSVLLSARFGRAAFAQVMGANMPLLLPFNICGLPMTTLIFERTGSYLPAFTLLLGGYVVAVIAVWLFRLDR